MADSTLLTTGESLPGTHKGHGTAALGPSDSSDTGSDIRGGPGLADDDGLGLRAGTTSDPDVGDTTDAGADIGDADLDSDSDRHGTGERAAVGRDATRPTDRSLHDGRGREIDGEDLAEADAADLDGEGADADYADLDTTLDRADDAGDADLDDARRSGDKRR